ncbi:beta-lactamase family protein [Aquihabitans sp. G128]|uniref:serine hydrolase domain-containing protein n=1 Tax=Aquihabitans sp. G128 TaxID=2849779 RepID=UPI001C24B9B8|nr:serine hydrolase domain-containing protein [Aquihabitans sp. G128]QXC62411.1 beta-lactamase family protein [Aquihabitans sp. G128]
MIRVAKDELEDGALCRWLHEQCEAATLFTGAQVHVCKAQEVLLDRSFGTTAGAGKLVPSSAFRMYCTAKPVLVAALEFARRQGVLRLDDPLGAFVPSATGPLGDVRLEALLDHQLPLGTPSGFAAVVSPLHERQARLIDAAQAAVAAGGPATYSEYLAWELLAVALQRASDGLHWADSVRAACRELGTDHSELLLDDRDFQRAHEAGGLECNVSTRRGASLPLLGEISPVLWSRFEGASFGIASSIRCLTALIHHAFVLSPTDRHAKPAAVVAGYGPARRKLHIRAGLMAGTSTIGVSDLWPEDLLGHTGLAGMSLVAGSPSLGLTFGVHLNGLMDLQTTDRYVRPLVSSTLHADLLATGHLAI